MDFRKIEEQLIGEQLAFPFFTEKGHVWTTNLPLEKRDIDSLITEGFTYAFVKGEPQDKIQFDSEMLYPLKGEIGIKSMSSILRLLDTSPYFRLLLKAVKDYDLQTYKHSMTTASVAIQLCENLEYSELDILRTSIAALLHDVGKCCIPLSLLNRPGALDEKARWLMEKHVWYSHLIISYAWDSDLANMVYTHHERVDGTGYPRKLKGDEITELSKVLMIADVYSALTEERPYKKPYDNKIALEIIKSGFSGEEKLCDLLEKVINK